MANANRDTERKPEPFSPADFFSSLADMRVEEPEETMEEFEARLDAAFAAFGAKPIAPPG